MTRTLPTTEAAAQLAAWWRVVELCLPSHRRCGALTFRPAGAETVAADWEAWLDTVFRPVLEPALGVLAAAANAGDTGAVLAADNLLGRSLPPSAARASLMAGRAALLEHEPPRGARMLERVRAVARSDEESGHLATVFAVRGQAFHLPAVQLRGAILLAECVAGTTAAGFVVPAGTAVEMLHTALHGAPTLPCAELAAV